MLTVGVGSDFFTNIILTILGYFPGALVNCGSRPLIARRPRAQLLVAEHPQQQEQEPHAQVGCVLVCASAE